jgi:hypothetical protein
LNLVQRFVLAAAPQAIPVGDESVIKNCVNPTAQVASTSPLMPAGKGLLEGCPVPDHRRIAVEQCAGKPAQSQDMLFEEFDLVQSLRAESSRLQYSEGRA